MAKALGLKNPRTFIATGNLVFESKGAPNRLEMKLEKAFIETFGRQVDIVIRSAPAWRDMIAGNPFLRESTSDGSRVIVRIMRGPLDAEHATLLAKRCADGERVKIVAGDLWVHFPIDPVRSKLIGALTTKNLGVGTLRNWNTVRRLGELIVD